MKIRTHILLFSVLLFGVNTSLAQNLTSSPYSRFGFGELNQSGFAQISAMGGAYVALRPDSTSPVFINAANPAALGAINLSSLELGGMGLFSNFRNSNTNVNAITSNFSYACFAFNLRNKAGIAFGLMPHSNVGYSLQSSENVVNIGEMTYQYFGEGGINKVFAGMGVMPFKSNILRFQRSAFRDSLLANAQVKKYKRIKWRRELLSELSVGAKANYLFGSLNHVSNVVYPGSIYYYNTQRLRSTSVSDITAGFGAQTSFNIDSVNHRSLRHRVKIGFGYYVSLPTLVNASYDNLIYNYVLGGQGLIQVKDTVLNIIDQKSSIRLPLEQGIGLSFKKGERLTMATDFTFTKWQQFRYLDMVNELSNSYRINFGLNFVQNKKDYNKGAYAKRIQYRFGFTYSNGFLELKNTAINNYAVTIGLGLPVGAVKRPDQTILANTVNLSAQFGRMGSVNNNLIEENYIRLIIGFTFNDKWFEKRHFD